MSTGLVGVTGFVGSTIARQREIDHAYHRSDIAEIRGQRFSRLYISGAPAQKWLANDDPAADAEGLERLADHLSHTRSDIAILISTVDVYPDPVEVDEETAVAAGAHPQAYGRNRLWLEHAVREHFPRTLVVRLPGLFGQGLRKNLVFDLLHEREEFGHRDSVYQFYDLARLCDDIAVAEAAGLDLVNLATAPLAASDVAREVFGRELLNTAGTPARYDMRTRHADLFTGSTEDHYVMSGESVLDAMRAFVATERSRA